MTAPAHGRDFAGYRGDPPRVSWPGGAQLALSIVVNVEEGAELSLGIGDELNEGAYEVVERVDGARDLCMESHYEYGTRAGWPRIRDALAARGCAATLNACRDLRRRFPRVAIVALATSEDPAVVNEALAAGVGGYLMINTSPTLLGWAILAARAGRTVVDPQIRRVEPSDVPAAKPFAPEVPLTRRESDVLDELLRDEAGEVAGRHGAERGAGGRCGHVRLIPGALRTPDRTADDGCAAVNRHVPTLAVDPGSV